MGIYGQDWASYQSDTPDTSGIDFTFIKVTEGLSYESPNWKSQYAAAKKAGLVIGFYHYPHMANSPVAEVNYFLSKVTPKPGEMVVLDWEGYDFNNRNVSDAAKVTYRDQFLSYLSGKLPNNPVGMYCNTDYWFNVDRTGNCGDFLWIATAGKPAGQPGIKDTWKFHQYSTAGDLDRNYGVFASRKDLQDWVNSFNKLPKPPKPPVPTPIPKPRTYSPPPFPVGLAPNKSTPSAKKLQQALKDAGWLDKGVTLADNYGPKTQAAVAGFNNKHRLNDVGVSYDPAIGPRGWALLFTLAYG